VLQKATSLIDLEPGIFSVHQRRRRLLTDPNDKKPEARIKVVLFMFCIFFSTKTWHELENFRKKKRYF
tara:strand:+ start:127 stop:330 length:204 start_codon:yes stop_codon:yes gene_type:complete